jgi:hypothetical protein
VHYVESLHRVLIGKKFFGLGVELRGSISPVGKSEQLFHLWQKMEEHTFLPFFFSQGVQLGSGHAIQIGD